MFKGISDTLYYEKKKIIDFRKNEFYIYKIYKKNIFDEYVEYCVMDTEEDFENFLSHNKSVNIIKKEG